MFSLHLAQKGHPSKFIVKTLCFNEFSMFAFLPGAPRGRHERLKKKATQHSKNTTKTSKNEFSRGPGPSLQKSQPKTAKKSPPGGQNDPQERPRRGRERPKRSQDDPKSAPRAPQEPPRGGLRAALVATWGRPGAQEAPGALRGGLLAPSGVDFGPSGAPFSKLPALLAEPCGEQAQAQKRKRRRKRKAQAQGAQSQGQQAARPTSLKDSGARRDVRSTLIISYWPTLFLMPVPLSFGLCVLRAPSVARSVPTCFSILGPGECVKRLNPPTTACGESVLWIGELDPCLA